MHGPLIEKSMCGSMYNERPLGPISILTSKLQI